MLACSGGLRRSISTQVDGSTRKTAVRPPMAADQVARGNADDGQVRVRIVANDAGGKVPAVGQGDVDLVGVMHDVAVRNNVAVGRKNKSRTAAAARAARPTVLPRALHVDLDDRRARDFRSRHDRVRINVQNIGVRQNIFGNRR